MRAVDIGWCIWLSVVLIRIVAYFRQLGSKKDRALLGLLQDVVYTIWITESIIAGTYWFAAFYPLAAISIFISYKKWKNTDDDDDKHWKLKGGKSKIKAPWVKTIPVPN